LLLLLLSLSTQQPGHATRRAHASASPTASPVRGDRASRAAVAVRRIAAARPPPRTARRPPPR